MSRGKKARRPIYQRLIDVTMENIWWHSNISTIRHKSKMGYNYKPIRPRPGIPRPKRPTSKTGLSCTIWQKFGQTIGVASICTTCRRLYDRSGIDSKLWYKGKRIQMSKSVHLRNERNARWMKTESWGQSSLEIRDWLIGDLRHVNTR